MRAFVHAGFAVYDSDWLPISYPKARRLKAILLPKSARGGLVIRDVGARLARCRIVTAIAIAPLRK